MNTRYAWALAASLLLGACAVDDAPPVDAGDLLLLDASVTADAAEVGCDRPAAAADRARKVVISLPYEASNAKANRWAVWELDTSGALTATATTFDMGRGLDGSIAFTRDGAIGMVAQEDGTVGVFRFDGDAVTVVNAGWDGDGADGFWASRVIMGPESRRAYVLNSQWRNNGGGIYSVAIACDGTPTLEGLVAASKLPYMMTVLPDGRALVAARDILDSATAGNDTFLVDLAAPPSVVATAAGFGDDEAIVGGAALTADRKYWLVGDINGFSATAGDRVAVVSVSTDALAPVQVLAAVKDPIAILASPHDDFLLVASGFENAIYRIDYDPANTTAPMSFTGEITYTGASPQLPGGMVMVERGSLAGMVLLSENQGVRRVRLGPTEPITDLGLTRSGSGVEWIVGAIGVQP